MAHVRSVDRIRFIGGALAFLLSASAAVGLVFLAASLPMSWASARIWTLLAALAVGIGAGVGAVLGWHMATAAADLRRPLVAVVGGVAWRAILLGALAVAVLGSIGPGDDLSGINDRLRVEDVASSVLVPVAVRTAWAMTAFVGGILVFSIPVVLVVTPVIAIWAIAVRRIVTGRWVA